MHLHQPSLSVKAAKAYKELVKKANATQIGDEPTTANALLQQTSSFIAQQRSSISFNRAFYKLQQALVGTDLQGALNATKQRARQQLRAALLGQPKPEIEDFSSAVTASELTSPMVTPPELSQLFGQYGPLRSAVVYIVGHASRMLLYRMNHTEVSGAEVLQAALQRPQGQALITVSNHVAAMDDPLVVSAILPSEALSKPGDVRWTLCASDRCFRYAAMVPFFRAGKVLPIERGAGTEQRGMRAAEDRLQHGEWVHIFPEGTRTRDGSLGAVRKGVGRLVAASGLATPPLVVPFVHVGMEAIMPRGKLLPALGKQVRVLVGEPIPMDDLLASRQAGRCTDEALHGAIAARIARRLHAMHDHLRAYAPASALVDAAVPPSIMSGAAHAANTDSSVGSISGSSITMGELDLTQLRQHEAAAALALWLGDDATSNSIQGDGSLVSGLDLYDPKDASRPRALWKQRLDRDKAVFKAQHREWLVTTRAAALRLEDASLAAASSASDAATAAHAAVVGYAAAKLQRLQSRAASLQQLVPTPSPEALEVSELNDPFTVGRSEFALSSQPSSDHSCPLPSGGAVNTVLTPHHAKQQQQQSSGPPSECSSPRAVRLEGAAANSLDLLLHMLQSPSKSSDRHQHLDQQKSAGWPDTWQGCSSDAGTRGLATGSAGSLPLLRFQHEALYRMLQ